jgi:hypothetical protein
VPSACAGPPSAIDPPTWRRSPKGRRQFFAHRRFAARIPQAAKPHIESLKMESPAEGRQIILTHATKAQLRAFANHLGATTTNFDNEAKLRDKIAAAGWDEAHIIAFDAPSAKKNTAPKGSKAGVVTNKADEEVKEPMVRLLIHTQEGPGGKRHVFVGNCGKALLIPRNKECEVKLRYFTVLRDAVETKYEYDEEAKANLPREMPSYPYQVISMPSEAEQKAWYAYEAKQEAKARRNEKAPVAAYDAAGAD